MAVGILTVGLLMVAGTFPVGIHLTALSTERTIGAAAADEAFAKVQLYGNELDFSSLTINNADLKYCYDFNDVVSSYSSIEMPLSEKYYPSTSDLAEEKKYLWSAIFKFANVDDKNQRQITVFSSRMVTNGLKYFEPDNSLSASNGYPVGDQGTIPKPIKLGIQSISVSNKKEIKVASSYFSGTTFSDYITDESVIVDDITGNIYRVVEVDVPNETFYIDKDWQGSSYSSFWVVPPPVGGGKYPCVGVYQRLISF